MKTKEGDEVARPSLPFSFEMRQRIEQARRRAQELSDVIDEIVASHQTDEGGGERRGLPKPKPK